MRFIYLFLAACVLAGSTFAQTTEGLILGRISNEVTGESIDGATVSAVQRETGARFRAVTSKGAYVLARIPPGTYDLSVESLRSYRPARIERVELAVAGFVRQDMKLRLLADLWQQNLMKSVVARDQRTVLLFYGPDVDLSRSMAVEESASVHGTLEPTVSDVASERIIDRAPLAGRDAYQLITLVPGATPAWRPCVAPVHR